MVVQMFHPPPASRTTTVMKNGLLTRMKKDCVLTLEGPYVFCTRAGSEEVGWQIDMRSCKVIKARNPNSVKIMEDNQWNKQVQFKSDVEFKDWVNELNYASSWSFDNFYERGELVGEGGFAQVYKCTSKDTGTIYACKEMKLDGLTKSALRLVNLEVEILRDLDSPYFPKVFDLFEDSSTLFIVMEYIEGCDLFTVLERRKVLPEEEAKHYMKEILQGLEYLHNKGYMHRDLKPENIMVIGADGPTPKIKIVDFGLADSIENGLEKKFSVKGTGTTGYMAPEIIAGEAHTETVDIWGCGCILYMMLSGTMPFVDRGRKITTISLKSLNADYRFDAPEWANVTEEARGLINMLLWGPNYKRPSARISLHHRWFRPERHKFNSSVSNLMRFRRAVHAVSFLFCWNLKTLKTNRSLVVIKDFGTPRGSTVSDIFEKNATLPD